MLSHILRMTLWVQSLLVGVCVCLLLLAIHLQKCDHGTSIAQMYPSPLLDLRTMPSEKLIIEETARLLPSLPLEAWEKVKNICHKIYYKNASCALYPVIYNLKFENTYWQILNTSNGTFHLYGAYYDTRPLLTDPVVRILGMIDKIEPTVETYCQIWMESQNEPLIIKADKYRYVWYPTWGNFIQDTVQPYLISCPMPAGYQGKTPVSVSLVEHICDNATNNVRVIFDKPAEKKKFAVCVKGLDFLYTDLSVKLAEWIELLHILGADKVFFYTLHVHANISKVLNYYEKVGKVNVTQLTLPGGQPNAPGFQHLYLSKKVATKRQNELIPYNDCFYKNMYTYDYIALLDIDEVIIPVEVDTWSELMEKMEPLSLSKNPSPAGSYNIRNAYFYDDVQKIHGWRNDIPAYMHMLQHVYRAREFSEPGKAVKCFHNTQKVLVLHNHYPLGCVGRDCISFSVDPKHAILHHYRGDCVPTTKETCQQIRNESLFDGTIWRYKDVLMKNVMTSLRDMGFFY